MRGVPEAIMTDFVAKNVTCRLRLRCTIEAETKIHNFLTQPILNAVKIESYIN